MYADGDYLRKWADSIEGSEISAFVDERRKEDLQLEFKMLTAPGRLRERLQPEDRKNFAKAVSGFANSDGGLLIWGVTARRDTDGVDAAESLDPILHVAQVVTELEHHTGQAASPIVDGITHRPIIRSDESGFIVTCIPASDRGPHMAKLGEDRYYKRSGDSFYKMEHFDIADMFGRRAHPVLRLDVQLLRNPMPDAVAIAIGIYNTGRGIARFPALRLAVDKPFQISRFGIDGNGREGLPRAITRRTEASDREVLYIGGNNHVVHAGVVFDVARIVSEQTERSPLIKYQIFAEGVQPVADVWSEWP